MLLLLTESSVDKAETSQSPSPPAHDSVRTSLPASSQFWQCREKEKEWQREAEHSCALQNLSIFICQTKPGLKKTTKMHQDYTKSTPLSGEGLSNNAFKQQIEIYLQNAGHVLSLSFLPKSSRVLLCEQQLQCQARGWWSCRTAGAYIPVDPGEGSTHPGSVSHISLFMPRSFHPSAPATGCEPAQHLPSVTWPSLIHGSGVFCWAPGLGASSSPYLAGLCNACQSGWVFVTDPRVRSGHGCWQAGAKVQTLPVMGGCKKPDAAC